MKIARLTLFGALATLVLMFGSFAGACGDDGAKGGDAPPLEVYFRTLEGLNGEFEQRTHELDAQFQKDLGDTSSVPEALEAYRELFRGGLTALEEFVASIEALDPPPEVAQAHERAVATGRDLVGGFQRLVEGLATAGTGNQIQALVTDPEFQAATAAFDQVCLDLQVIADENAVDVALDCG